MVKYNCVKANKTLTQKIKDLEKELASNGNVEISNLGDKDE